MLQRAASGERRQEATVRPLPVASIALAAHPASSRASRAFVAEHLRAWGLDAAVDDASLLVSELVTNAIVHGRSPIELMVRKVRSAVRVEVCDDGRRPARSRLPDADAPSGRGLSLVEAVASRWGIADEAGPGNRVWFEIAL